MFSSDCEFVSFVSVVKPAVPRMNDATNEEIDYIQETQFVG